MTNRIQIVDLSSPVSTETTPETASESVPYLGNNSFEDRSVALKAMARAAGIRLQETIVPEGTSLIQYGEERKARMAKDVAALPTLEEGLPAFVNAVREEKHVDVTVPMARVRMSAENGGIYGQGNEKAPLAYTRNAFSHLAEIYKPDSVRSGFGSTLLALPEKLRSEVFNWSAENKRVEENAVIRTFVSSSGRRTIRAVTSDRHSLESGDDISIAQALAALPKGGKLRVTRSAAGEHSTFEVLFPMMARELKVGDVAMGAIRIQNSETKKGALRVDAQLLQVLCLNFTTAWSIDEESEELSLRHIGELSRRLPRVIQAAQKRIEPFVRAFGDAYKVAFPEFAPTRGEILARVAKVYELPESTLDVAAQVWNTHASLTDNAQRDTLAGLVNALTRAAQDETMVNAAAISDAAGKLVVNGWGALA